MGKTTARADLSAELARARAIGVDLAVATDELNKAFTEAEAALIRMHLGVTASVVIDDEEGHRSLVFGKHGGAWRLLIEHNWGDESTEEPLVNANKELRLLAAKQLGDLVKQLAVTASEQINEVRSATEAVREVVAVIKEGEARDDEIPF